ncbi:cytochrome C biogenesis protein [Candidatus Woesearchaeota archaeon]|nr:MAG: cytochrome C biogenesis protein [Candidatus Woesearchaeota archaeon]
MAEVTIFIAFLAGLVSFLAPCVLPLVPAFLGYLAGARIEQTSRWVLFWHSFLFVLGFSAVFSALGVLLNSFLSNVAYDVQIWLGRIAGVIIIFFGFYLLGLIKPKFLETEHKLKVKRFKSKSVTSFVFGAAFAVGWTPCVGAVLGTILALAASQPGSSLVLLLSYSLGLGLPFLLVGLFARQFLSLLERNGHFLKYFNTVVGIIIVILGALVFTGKLALIANFGILSEVLLR